MTLDDILKEIKKAETICILAHENPDGDAIGSSLGLYDVLTRMGKNTEVLMKNVPETLTDSDGYNSRSCPLPPESGIPGSILMYTKP